MFVAETDKFLRARREVFFHVAAELTKNSTDKLAVLIYKQVPQLDECFEKNKHCEFLVSCSDRIF